MCQTHKYFSLNYYKNVENVVKVQKYWDLSKIEQKYKKWDNDEFYKKYRWSRLTQIEIKKKVFKINKVCCIALFVLIVYVSWFL